MAISIDIPSATIEVDKKGAIPAVATGIKRAVIHLTRGFLGADLDPPTDNNAFKITGTVKVFADTVAESDDVLNGSWKFGFVQILKVDSVSFTWSGRRDSEGEVFLPLSSPPAWPPGERVCMDAGIPFYNSLPLTGSRKRPAPGQKIEMTISNVMTDHPGIGTGYRAPNRVTKSTNFLSSMERELEGFSIYAAQQGNGPVLAIAHVHWHLQTEATFTWRKNKPSGAMRTKIFEFSPPLQGAPRDTAVQAMFLFPGGRLHNDIAFDALQRAGHSRVMRQESERRSLFLAKDFFQ